MTLIGNLFRSSIGRKFLMAITGLILIGFVVGHLVGNLQIFAHPDKINGYAHFLQSLGPALWAVRLGLLACIAIHIWAAVVLTLENKSARGPSSYGVTRWLQAAWASRYMRLSGIVVLAFIIYHLAHFTIGASWAEGGNYKTNLAEYQMQSDFHLLGFPVVAKGEAVHDVYSMVYLGFSNPIVSGFYILAITLLTIHLLHGMDSLFQTLGWRNQTWASCLRKVVGLFCFLYLAGNIAIPGAILSGFVKPAPGTVAATACTTDCCSTPVATAIAR
ncbi:succinate dehydrogenase [Nibricoccus aquaticus]|uniref:Succinate dehydrogenase n=1 Tax=Nibricoccus aquaticus TaxID=2576891 RepID=A0A290Q5R2_9BACT|nr:succinate dehydrogenase cytochrome b subunit [Nibricoccus aquaticus]ATC63617.1 succinate dehydrogenase [Nibricoccus aquaticus]